MKQQKIFYNRDDKSPAIEETIWDIKDLIEQVTNWGVKKPLSTKLIYYKMFLKNEITEI